MKLTIQKVVFGGDGLAERDGKAVFVEGALPGETVEAEITEEKKNFSRAKLLRVLTPSPHRVEPPCPYISHCGGCQYQHVSYEEELRLKEAQVREIFARAGIEAPIRPLVRSDREFGYRSSLTLHPVDPRSKPSTRLGLFAKDNRKVIPIKNCLLADPAFAPVFSAELQARKCPERVTFKLDASGRIANDLQESFMRMRLGPETYLVPSGGFFQMNPGVAVQILRRIVQEVSAFKPEVLFDLFAGVGTFGLACAEHAGKIVFLEESRPSLQALEMNLRERGVSHSRVAAGRVERQFASAWKAHSAPRSMIVLDPPRAGIHKRLCLELAHSQAKKLLYLSCEPTTLVRDLKILISSGMYALERIEIFDMFPKTKHVEIIISLYK